MTDKTKAQRVESLLDLINEWGHMPACDDAVSMFTDIASQLRSLAMPDDPPGDAGLLRELRDRIARNEKIHRAHAEEVRMNLHDHRYLKGVADAESDMVEEFDHLLAAAAAANRAAELLAECERLTAWKREAELSFKQWDKVVESVTTARSIGKLKWHVVTEAIERLTKERDNGWEELERLRHQMTEGLSVVLPHIENAPFLHSMREAWQSAVALVDKALASRPGAGKEGGRG